MYTIQEKAFRTDFSLSSSLVAQLEGPAYDIEVNQLNLPTPGNGHYYSHSHCFLEYVMVPEHALSASYPSVQGKRPIGQLIFIPPGVELEWHWQAGQQRTVTCMFELERIGALGGIDWDWSNIDLSRTFDIQNHYLLMGMRKLAEEAIEPGFASDIQIENTLSLMGIELHRQLLGQSPLRLAKSHSLGKSQLGQLREYVFAHLAEEISVTDLARLLEMNARELSESFKQSTGLTLRQFLANARVEKAKSLLAKRDLMIKQVGYQCGFKGPAAFVAAFRKITGYTPADYRNRFY